MATNTRERAGRTARTVWVCVSGAAVNVAVDELEERLCRLYGAINAMTATHAHTHSRHNRM